MQNFITTKEKFRKMDAIEKDRVFLYHLVEAKKEIRKGNQTMEVLYELLIKEIKKHNGIVLKKYNKIRYLPTTD